MANMADRIRLTELFSLYGSMLTSKQQKALSLQLDEDFSLSEIGEELGVSRQAVHDLLTRTRQKLEEYESELRFIEQQQEQRTVLTQIYRDIKQLAIDDASRQVDDILARLEPYINRV